MPRFPGEFQSAPSRRQPRTESPVADRVRAQQLTSYGGLELLRRYLRQLEIPRRLHAACTAVGGDYSGSRLALLLMALLYVGARRLEHLQYLVGDPLIRRFAGLAPV